MYSKTVAKLPSPIPCSSTLRFLPARSGVCVWISLTVKVHLFTGTWVTLGDLVLRSHTTLLRSLVPRGRHAVRKPSSKQKTLTLWVNPAQGPNTSGPGFGDFFPSNLRAFQVRYRQREAETRLPAVLCPPLTPQNLAAARKKMVAVWCKVWRQFSQQRHDKHSLNTMRVTSPAGPLPVPPHRPVQKLLPEQRGK